MKAFLFLFLTASLASGATTRIIGGPQKTFINSPAAQLFGSSNVLWFTFDGNEVNWTNSTGGLVTNHIGSQLLYFTNMTISANTFAGKRGQALVFDGVNDAASSVGTINLTNANKLTVCFWYFWNAPTTGDPILLESTVNAGANTNSFYIDCGTANNLQVNLYGGGNSNPRAEAVAIQTSGLTNKWNHLCVVLDNSTTSGEITIYTNGVNSATTLAAGTHNTVGTFGNWTWYLGGRGLTSLFCKGKLDDLRVYTNELTAAQIGQVFTNGLNFVGP